MCELSHPRPRLRGGRESCVGCGVLAGLGGLSSFDLLVDGYLSSQKANSHSTQQTPMWTMAERIQLHDQLVPTYPVVSEVQASRNKCAPEKFDHLPDHTQYIAALALLCL
jgi:hypothetical protein